jgi:hypothetical protein
MVIRNISLALAVIGLTGCITPTPRVVTETVPISIPVLYCPAPPEFTRPELALDPARDGQQMSDGELVKAYNATIVALQGYATQLETALQGYEDISEETADLQRKIDELIKQRDESGQP